MQEEEQAVAGAREADLRKWNSPEVIDAASQPSTAKTGRFHRLEIYAARPFFIGVS